MIGEAQDRFQMGQAPYPVSSLEVVEQGGRVRKRAAPADYGDRRRSSVTPCAMAMGGAVKWAEGSDLLERTEVPGS